MDQEFLKQLAQQLRKPEGEMGIKVGENMNSGNEIMNRSTLEQVNAQAGEKIMEIGMGNGFFVNELLSSAPSIHYTGCDYSELMIREASVRNESWIAKGRAKFILTAADKLPFENKTFDKIFTVNTIYFWENPNKELAEIKRVLKDKGSFFLTVRSEETLKNIPVTQYGFTIYSNQELMDLLSGNGFTVTQVIENQEPDMEFSGTKIKMSSRVFCCRL